MLISPIRYIGRSLLKRVGVNACTTVMMLDFIQDGEIARAYQFSYRVNVIKFVTKLFCNTQRARHIFCFFVLFLKGIKVLLNLFWKKMTVFRFTFERIINTIGKRQQSREIPLERGWANHWVLQFTGDKV